MILKNLFRIIFNYKLFTILIVYFEFIYLIKGYKGNKFNFSDNALMTDNIPCPYYFLYRIKKTLQNYNFNKFIDLGCGSGRVIDFFNKNFPNKNLLGVEYFDEQFIYSEKIFKKNSNINIIKSDFTKIDLLLLDADCYFLNDPFSKSADFISFIEKIVKLSLKKKTLFVFVNCDKKIISNLKNLQYIENYYLNEKKGYSIYCSN
jgi:SAM-dependent methyltransferase